MGRGAALVAAIAATLVMALTGTAFATGGGHGGGSSECKGGQAVGKGATLGDIFEFTVCQKSANTHDASGYFSATVPATPNVPILTPKGPVTCADIEGQDATFFYPFGAGSVPPATPAAYGRLIYVHDGGANGAGDKFGFLVVPQAISGDCTLAGASGTIAKTTALPLTSGDIAITHPDAGH